MMTVHELIDILQTLPKNKVVQVQDTNVDDTADLSIWHFDDRVEILGMPDTKKWDSKLKRFIKLNIER